MTDVVLIDDHRVVRSGLRVALETEPDLVVVGEADSVDGGRRLLAQGLPDVVVCDVALGDGSGIDLVRTCRERSTTVGLVVLTMHHDDETLFAALDAGASALVLKSADLDELISAVRRAAVSPDVFSGAGLGAAMRRRAQSPGPLLTRRESEVLNLLKDGLSVHEVSRRLFLSDSTVKTHVAKLYDKLGATNRAQAIMIAVRKGLLDD